MAAFLVGVGLPTPAAAMQLVWSQSVGSVRMHHCVHAYRCPAAGLRCGGTRLAEAEEGARRFVGWFREAWPYIRDYRGSTFIVLISGEVVAGPNLDGILQVYIAPDQKDPASLCLRLSAR